MHTRIIILICFGFASSASAQSADDSFSGKLKNDAQLKELHAATVPKPAGDLDTLQLASAHRERAATIDEKTNGLWQSWTTSVCEGCGNTPSYQDTVQNYLSRRKSLSLPLAEATRAKQPSPPEASGRSLYTVLSDENISQIRRMPER